MSHPWREFPLFVIIYFCNIKNTFGYISVSFHEQSSCWTWVVSYCSKGFLLSLISLMYCNCINWLCSSWEVVTCEMFNWRPCISAVLLQYESLQREHEKIKKEVRRLLSCCPFFHLFLLWVFFFFFCTSTTSVCAS